jgi:hypothetical protein
MRRGDAGDDCQSGVVARTMEKRLRSIGNSFGLVIDKPVLRMLGMGRGSILKLSTDGRRLIVERVDLLDQAPPPSSDPRLKLDAIAVAKTLMNRFGVGREEYERLHHKQWRPTRYIAHLECARPEEVTEADLTTMRRLEACLAECQAGATRDEAIARALAAHPIGDRE